MAIKLNTVNLTFDSIYLSLTDGKEIVVSCVGDFPVPPHEGIVGNVGNVVNDPEFLGALRALFSVVKKLNTPEGRDVKKITKAGRGGTIIVRFEDRNAAVAA